jgi:thioredoxin reductase (NADPH)
VVGGGNSAVEEALYLSNLARSVTVIHRRTGFRSERILQERLFAKSNVKVIWDTVVEEITGSPGKSPMPPSANGLKLKNVATGAEALLPIDGLFVAIGHAPAVELFSGKLRQKPSGYLWTEPNSTRTNIPGVFAAGDVADDVYRQAVTAAGLGCMAALEAERFLAGVDAHREAAE